MMNLFTIGQQKYVSQHKCPLCEGEHDNDSFCQANFYMEGPIEEIKA